jgi:hypothetical protein
LTVARVPLLLITFAALAAWAGAQAPPAPLTAADHVKLFKLDRSLLDNLVSHGVDLADTGDALTRAEECRKTAQTLTNYLERAAKDERDADRVAELADLVGDVFRDGLTPNLDEAKRTIPPESPDGKRVVALQKLAAADLDAVKDTIPAGKVADHAKVKDALSRLAELKSKLGK